METADALFRRLGYAKTAVADIASELRMSPANVYRFFPSKTAIVQAICQRCLNELDEKIWTIARSKGSASERLEKLELEIFAYHKENLLEDQKVNDIVMVAMEESWDAIMAHKERIRSVIELVLRDGIESGEFEKVDPRETSVLIMRAYRLLLPSGPARPGRCRKASISKPKRARSSASCSAPSPPESRPAMTSSPKASLRLKSDDFLFSSVISHHNVPHATGMSDSPRRQSRVPAAWRSFAAVFVAGLVLAGCAAETAPAPKAERPVQIQRVRFDSTGAAREFVGVVRARSRDRSRLPRRRQDRRPRRQCRRPGPRRRRHRAARCAGPRAPGRKRRGRACRRDIQSDAGLRRSAALHHAENARLCRHRRFRPQAGGERRSRRPPDAGTARTRSRAQPARLCRTQEPTPTASSPQRWPNPARSSPSARRWRGSPIAARRKPSSRCPRRGSPRRSNRRRLCGCGPTATAASRRSCASCRRRPIKPPAPLRRVSRSSMPTTPSPSA